MRRAALLAACLPLFALAVGPPPPPSLSNGEPLSAEKERLTFAVPEGFRVELVAKEPNVVDPVAMAFDERGRILVAEMRGYPNGGRGTGAISSGRIKVLEDRDGDGFYETGRVLVEGLRFPTGVMPWRGGALVANAPDLLQVAADGTKTTLYTGFDVANIQQLLNSLQLGLDGKVHAVAGAAGGLISSPQFPKFPPVALRGRGIRFDPDRSGSLEPTSGGGQYGLSADEWGRWFTATNSQHLRHIVLPDEYLRRNPALASGPTTLDVPEHGAACKVFRTSPFEAWRLERTTRRKGGPDAKRFPSTELFPGGYVTSACSPLVYTADVLPQEYRGSVFVCDPANNLVLRDTLSENGSTFTARRGHDKSEFLTSTDNWFRPVHLTLGPDGAIYVLDFYREAIETPLSLPDDIKRRLNLESRGRGRIWRITTSRERPRPPALDKATTPELVAKLDAPSSWWRLTAQRLLQEKRDPAAVAPLKKLAAEGTPPGRAHALHVLATAGALDEELLLKALADKEAGLRENALALAGPFLAKSEALTKAAAARANDRSPRVRFQLALTLGESDAPEAVAALRALSSGGPDAWLQTAILSSCGKTAPALLKQVAKSAPSPFVARLAGLVGTTGGDDDLATALELASDGEGAGPWRFAVLDGLGRGLAQRARPIADLWERPSPKLAAPVAKAAKLFDRVAARALDEKASVAARADDALLLGRGPFAALEKVAAKLLAPQVPPEVQLAAVRALSAQPRRETAELLLSAWPAAGPTVRRELAEALFARRDRLDALLTAMEKDRVQAAHLGADRLARLRSHPDVAVRKRAAAALKGQGAPDRAKVVADYADVPAMKGDPKAGAAVFKKNCATCHRLDGVGVQVGADLLAALRNKSAEQLLIDVLDPSREVDPRFLSYVATTKAGQVLTGMIESETATSLTLKRGEGVADTVLRVNLESIESTGQSLMPEGMEAQIGKRDMADLIAYLRRAR